MANANAADPERRADEVLDWLFDGPPLPSAVNQSRRHIALVFQPPVIHSGLGLRSSCIRPGYLVILGVYKVLYTSAFKYSSRDVGKTSVYLGLSCLRASIKGFKKEGL